MEINDEDELINVFEHAILAYNELCRQWGDEDPISGDHWTGTSMVLFKGNSDDWEKVKYFIRRLKDNQVKENEIPV